jgi:DNA-binding beta-propeller fold protein YncE
VQEFSGTGEYLSGFGSTGWFTGAASGLAVSAGDLFVAEPLPGQVQEYSTTGTPLASFDERGSGNGKSQLPEGIASDPATGDLLVSDAGKDNVQEFSPAGAFIATFGSQGSGPGQFSAPKGVAVSSAGRFFVADTQNNRIEEWLTGP